MYSHRVCGPVNLKLFRGTFVNTNDTTDSETADVPIDNKASIEPLSLKSQIRQPITPDDLVGSWVAY